MNAFRTVRIFVSSTFKDMDFERDYLKNFVLPRLNNELLQYNILVELCDLRSGIAKKFASEQEQEEFILQSCFSAIKTTYPYFIALLGERYGWVPPKHSLENLKQLFGSFGVETLSVEDKSVTELEILLGALNKNVSNKGIICFRTEKSYENMPDDIRKLYIEDKNRQKLANLKNEIKAKYEQLGIDDKLIEYELEWVGDKFLKLDEWGDKVYDVLKSQIIDDIGPVVDMRSSTHRIMDSFVFSNIYKSIDNRTNWTEKVTHGLIREYNKLIFAGIEGVGNSTFLSQHYHRLITDHTNILPIFYSLDAPGADRAFSNIVEYLTKEVYNYVQLLYDECPEYNIDEPLNSLREAVDFVSDKEFHVLFIIDSYDKIYKHSNPFHHSLRWVPDNAAVIIGVDVNWASDFSEDVLVCPTLPLFDKGIAKKYVKSMGYNDLDDDTIEKILSPLYDGDDNNLAFYKTPLYIRMIIDLLVDLNHADYETIRSSQKEYTLALKEYREQNIPAEPTITELLFHQIVSKNSSVIGENGICVLYLLAIAKNGLTENTLRMLMGLNEFEFTHVLSKTFNKFSKYLSFAPDSGKWQFQYQLCKVLMSKFKQPKDERDIFRDILKILLPVSLYERTVQDDLFYYLIKSQDLNAAEEILSTRDYALLNSGAIEVAEGILHKMSANEYFDWCISLLNHNEGITEPKILFIIKVFEKLQLSSQLGSVMDIVRGIAGRIVAAEVQIDVDYIYTFMDFCNMMTDIYICEDMLEDAQLTNSIAVRFANILGEDDETSEFGLARVARQQERALIKKTKRYTNEEYPPSNEDDSILVIDLLEEVNKCKEALDKNPTHLNKMTLIKKYSELAVLLYDSNYNDAFMYHTEAIELISEVLNKSNDTNNLRTCSGCLYQWGCKCLESENWEMAKETLEFVQIIDENLLYKNETKENLTNLIFLYCKLIKCCTACDDEKIKELCRLSLLHISKHISEDFDLCCKLWLTIAAACWEQKAYYEAFFVYDTMADEITNKNDHSYVVLQIEVLIMIAEIAFIDGGVDAGLHRIQYPTQLINEFRPYLSREQDRITFDQLEEKCNSLIAMYVKA